MPSAVLNCGKFFTSPYLNGHSHPDRYGYSEEFYKKYYLSKKVNFSGINFLETSSSKNENSK